MLGCFVDNGDNLALQVRQAQFSLNCLLLNLPLIPQCSEPALMLVFVFVLASGIVAYQPQSIENCDKLAAAFSEGAKVAANVDGEDVPIVEGKCIRLNDARLLNALEAPPSTHVPSS
jgi:hypothetical protein